MRGRFVGRAREAEALQGVIGHALERLGPASGIVVGPPGSGKSRLLLEAIRGADPASVLRVVGHEPEQAVPLAAARDLLRALGRSPRGGRRLRAAAFGEQSWGATSAPLGLFEAAYRCLAERAPVIISVDDLQWIDELSTALLSYLLRASAADAVAVALVAAGRPSPTVGSLRDALAATLPPHSPLVQIELSPLPEDAGIAMVRSLAPAASPSDASRIWRAAAGSPFWIEALAIEGEALDAGMARRFRQLGEDAVGALQALAVIARPSDGTEIGTLLEWKTPRVEAALGALRGRGLVVEIAGTVELAHDLIREAARSQIPDVVARRLHARLAGELRTHADGDVRRLREALDHTRAAGEAALDIALELASAPGRRLLGTAGVAELATVAEAADPTDPRRRALEERLADLATELGERPLELERWLVVAEHPGSVSRARALHAASRAAYRMGMRQSAADLLARARATGSSDLAMEIALDALESEILRWLDHRLPEARRLTNRALERADDALRVAGATSDPLDRRLRAACMDALYAASDLALQEGNERDQARFAERIAELADGELERMEAQLLLASAYRRSGRMEEAERIVRRVAEQAEQRLYPAVLVMAGHHLARALYAQARMEEAERAAAQAEVLSARIGETGRMLSETRSLRPGITVSRGDWRAGIARLRGDIEREPDPHYQLGIQQEIATWLSRLAGPADADEVRGQVAAARRSLADVGCPRCGRELALRSAEALARIGDVEAAREAMAPQVGQQTRHSHEGRLYLRQAVGALLAASGRNRRAAACLARLVARLGEAGMHREALWADLDRAAALAPLDAKSAVAIYRSVADRAEAGGVLTDLHVARQRLRELGVRFPPPRQRPGLLGLSLRELEVARMAASGASNPEIASSLFLSRKTVERHVSTALAKVGARNRTELASRLASFEAQAGGEMRELPDTESEATT